MFNKKEFKKQVKSKAKEIQLDVNEKEKNIKKDLKRTKRIINLFGFMVILSTFVYVFFIR